MNWLEKLSIKGWLPDAMVDYLKHVMQTDRVLHIKSDDKGNWVYHLDVAGDDPECPWRNASKGKQP